MITQSRNKREGWYAGRFYKGKPHYRAHNVSYCLRQKLYWDLMFWRQVACWRALQPNEFGPNTFAEENVFLPLP